MIAIRNLTARRVRTAIFKKLYSKTFSAKFELSLVIAGARLMRVLNKKYRGKDEVANTLSFLLEHGRRGEIFLNFGERNLPRLFVHSALHLLGFDHRTKRRAQSMERKELIILQSQ